MRSGFFMALVFALVLGLTAQPAPVLAQQTLPVKKGVPANLPMFELMIVAYEPDDLIPAEAKSYEWVYRRQHPLEEMAAQANLQVQKAAKAGYPYVFSIIPQSQLHDVTGVRTGYIFEPAKLYGISGPWNSVPLYLKQSVSGQLYEIGFMPKDDVYSAEKIMEHFLKFIEKPMPVQALDNFPKK